MQGNLLFSPALSTPRMLLRLIGTEVTTLGNSKRAFLATGLHSSIITIAIASHESCFITNIFNLTPLQMMLLMLWLKTTFKD